MAIKLDLNSRVLSEAHGVFMARPGREYRLYDEFVNAKAIGPELPGLQLEPGKAIKDQTNLDTKLKRSAAVRKWLANGKPDSFYPADEAAYKKANKTPGHTAFRGLLFAYFAKADKGDLIIIPPRAFNSDAVIAEFSDEPKNFKNRKFGGFYDDFAIPTRDIKILDRLPKRKLPVGILDVIAKPSAFVMIEKSHRPFLYDRAYGSYSYAGNYSARWDVTKPTYNTNDDLYISAFANFVALNTKRVTMEQATKTVGIREAAFEDLGDFAPSLLTNVNSPGSLSFRSSYIIPLVGATMLSLALYVGPEAKDAADQGTLIIGNSAAGEDDECTAVVAESVAAQLRLMGAEEWAEACRIAREAEQGTGLQSTPSVERSNEQ